VKQAEIKDLEPGLVKGIEVQMPDAVQVYKERFFEWSASSLTSIFKINEISGGVLNAWHHVPVFDEVETHVDAEMFYFISGTALMLFIDMADGIPDMDTAQIVRIHAGTQIIISAGKGHFVAVAEGDEHVGIIVVSPKMEAPRTRLPIVVEGI
jgi:hypothetical protein